MLRRVAEIDRSCQLLRAIHHARQTFDQVIDIAERSRLRTVAKHGDVSIEQGLDDEARDHTSVIGVGPGAIGIEDAYDFDWQAVLPPIIEEQCLGTTLALIVAGARTNRIDVAPIGFGLWVDCRVAVDLAGRGLQYLDLEPLGEAKHVDRANHAGLGGLNGIFLVVDGRCRTCEVKNLVHLDEQRVRNVVTQQLKPLVIEKMLDIAPRAREKIIDAQDLLPPRQELLTKMGAEKPRASGN